MAPTDLSNSVVHNAGRRRFEMPLGHDELARADYRMDGDVMHIFHTEVPPNHEGQGIAAALVQAAIAHARKHELRVQPACSYVRSYFKRHPETHDLLPAGSAP
jgi:predicted GNAT family acetyltransferase